MGAPTFRVLWGDPFRGMTQELVSAFDVDEALVRAHERRPELPRPRLAFVVGVFSEGPMPYTSPDEQTV